MSESFVHDDGAGRPSASRDELLDEQLAAEIADHLASAAGDLVRRGEPVGEAERAALARFGDVARVKRQCWWIHNGDEVMYRTVGIALLSLLTVGVAVMGFGGWQLQRSVTTRTEELSARLASLAATQEAMLAQQRPPVVTGRAYLGDLSRPAANVEIQVYRFSEEPTTNQGVRASGVVVRRLHTDVQGRFDSGILQSGEYCLLASLVDANKEAKKEQFVFDYLQSRPLYLTAGVGQTDVDFNVAASARIRVSVDGIPNSVAMAGDDVRIFVGFTASTDGVHYYERRPVPPNDQPPRDGWPLPLPQSPMDVAGASVRAENLPQEWWFVPREYDFHFQLSFWSSDEQSKSPPVYTKPAIVNVKLTDSQVQSLRLNVAGHPLVQQAEIAAKEFEKDPEAVREKLMENAKAKGVGFYPIAAEEPPLRLLADGVELKVEIVNEENSPAK